MSRGPLYGYLLPLATIDEIRDDLADTERKLDELGQGRLRTLDPENRRPEVRAALERWRDRLRAQLAAMEADE